MTETAQTARPAHPVYLARRMLNRTERQYVEALQRRVAWLRGKVEKTEPQNRTYLTKELRATEWALANLSELPENERLFELLKSLDPPFEDRGTDE